ncbi:hypothetical protein GIB67_025582 [Kingdonia uniflora]|uniref:PROP1-like PPR domain-containing protein n=1 Tax=Kingdonia uniflora TaxID=39325 RepID=A0A7J7M0G8_9MAGN|nr:hypothetical protein GIB67_025582 [Kingdonia uniflora]
MPVNVQQINSSCLRIRGSIKSNGVSVSVSVAVEKANKVKEKICIESSNTNMSDTNISRVYIKPRNVEKLEVIRPSVDSLCLSKNPNGGVKLGSDKRRNHFLGKTEAKCSKKWLSYGGRLPSILQALDEINDIDMALVPWEDSLNVREKSIILKEQWSWERAVDIFEWFKRKGCYELNVIHYNIMFRIVGKARKWDLLDSLLREMEIKRVDPTTSTYGTLIDVYSKGGLMDEAFFCVESMEKCEIEPDEVTMGTVVQAYKKAGEFKKAEQFFKNWSLGKVFNGGKTRSSVKITYSGARICISAYTYNTLIDTYGKAGQLQEASATFARMLKDGIVPNTVTFNTMIHICGNHDRINEVISLMKRMEELRCSPDTRTYNILISLHAKHDDIHAAASYFTEMKEVGLKPDNVSYRTLLYAFSIRHMVGEAEALVSEMDEQKLKIDEYTQSALTRMYIDVGMLQRSWSWFERFHHEGNMSSECYSANIDAYGERNHVLEAEKAFICSLERKNFTVLEFNVMIKAYGVGKKYDEACELFDTMKKFEVLPNKCTYNSLIHILSSADRPHNARLYVRKMHKEGWVTDCVQYCSVISGYVKLGQLHMGEGLFKEMLRFGVKPDIVVFGIMINAFADIGNVKETLRYVNEMRHAGFSGNAVIYNSLIKLYTKVGYFQEAQETYKLFQSFNIAPDLYSSNCMIDLYSERAMVKHAEEIFEDLKQKDVANEFSYAMMLCMYMRVGCSKEAVEIAHKMRELGLLSDILSYNNIIKLYVSDGRLKEAIRTFWEMRKSSVQPDDFTFRSLGAGLVRRGASKEAINKLELARKKDAQGGLRDWIVTLSSMVGMDENSQRLCQETSV